MSKPSLASTTKRGAEDFARVHHGGSESKKPRFDLRNPSALAPDADDQDEETKAVLDADVIGARGQQTRRNAVNIDGYDSDSDNDNFDARARERDRQQKRADREAKSKDEEDDDMFADLEEKQFPDGDDSEGDGDLRGVGRKKNIRFLDENEIEGQVKNSTSGGHVSADFSMTGKGKAKTVDYESSSESEVDDAVRADHGDLDKELGAGGKKDHAPKLDAFNMRNENDEGRFDEEGNYVRKTNDPDAIHDNWLEGISKKDMKKANDAHQKQEEERRKKALENDAKAEDDILRKLLSYMNNGETVLQALARQRRGAKPKKKPQRGKKSNAVNATEAMEMEPERLDQGEKNRILAVESITEAVVLLEDRGYPNVYDTEKAIFARRYQQVTGDPWVDPVREDDGATWQYRFTDGRDNGTLHGPYDTNTMKAWQEYGYFVDEPVVFRRVGMNGWADVAEFV